jgi:hypothetical protein
MSIVSSGLTSTSCYIVTGNTDGTLVFKINNNGTTGGTTALTLDANSYASFTSSLQATSLGIGTAASGVVGEIRASNNITAYYSSDVRLKKNIVPIFDALAAMDKIRGVRFEWTDDYLEQHGGEDDYFNRRHDVGVIAQELREVLPELVAESADGSLAVKYDRIVALLIQSVKELKQEINELKKK